MYKMKGDMQWETRVRRKRTRDRNRR